MIRLRLRITRSAGKEKSTSMPKPLRLKSPLATLLRTALTGSDQTSETGFVAQIVLKTFLPLPQTDSAYGFCLGYAKSSEAI
jgi:hypothetical protein